jgi:hypothetical protein
MVAGWAQAEKAEDIIRADIKSIKQASQILF